MYIMSETESTIALVILVAALIGLPVLAVYRIKQWSADAQATRNERLEREGHAKGLSDVQIRNLQHQSWGSDFFVRYYYLFAVAAIVLLAVIMPFLSLGVILVFLAQMFRKSQILHQEVKGKRPAHYTDGPPTT